jgi:kumamolisin
MSVITTDLEEVILISVYLRRDTHENGMTLQEYADGIIAGDETILNHKEFVYQFGTTDDDLNKVVAWAESKNLIVEETHHGGAVVKLSGTARQFNELFGIQLETVTENNRTFITHPNNQELSIPAEIADVVEEIFGLDNSVGFTFDARQDPSLEASSYSSPYPNELAKGYNFPKDPAVGDNEQGKGACVAILELGGGWTNANITSTFGQIGWANPSISDVSVDGGVNDGGIDTGASGEVMLDIWCVGATAPQAKQVIYFAPNSFQGFIDIITAVANDTTYFPSVLSISWGTTDSNWSSGSRALFETALASCAVKGVTVLVASGDYGVRALSGGATYTVQYPGTSPYVISAGGTVVTLNSSYAITAEVPWGTSGGSFAGGGGVSTIFSTPSWQTGLASKLYPGGGIATLTGRGIPDVSAHAIGYSFYYGSGNTFGSGFVGTSATAPLMAGMIARINQLSGQRIGFVNSTWYANRTTIMNDITTGDNHGGNSVGYMATTGWDAATGIGTPIGTKIYGLYRTGSTYPKGNYAFRAKATASTSNQTYPRTTTGILGRTSTTRYDATYTVVPNTTSISPGGQVTYTVTTTNVPDATILYWQSYADWNDGLIQGTVVISGNTGSFTRTLNSKTVTSSVITTIKVTGQTGQTVATASTVAWTGNYTISITPSATDISVGDSITWNITTTGFGSGTVQFGGSGEIGSRSANWTDGLFTNPVTITNDSGSLTKTSQAEQVVINPPGTQAGDVYITVYPVNAGGVNYSVPLYTSSSVIIHSTPIVNLTLQPTNDPSKASGTTVTYSISVQGVWSGYPLYWSLYGDPLAFGGAVFAADFSDGITSGSITLSQSNSAVCTGTLAGMGNAVMNVYSIVSGTIEVGMTLSSNLPAANGTFILNQGSGTGGIGTYYYSSITESNGGNTVRTVTLSGGTRTASITKTINTSTATVGHKFGIQIRRGSTSGPILLSSNLVTIQT